MLASTRWPVPLAGAIAVIEEVGERPYEIDRYLTHLALHDAIADLAGAVIGDLTRCVDPSPPSGEPDPEGVALATIRERLAVPIASGAPIGHGTRNEAIPFGAAAELDLDRGTLAIVEPSVQ